MTKFSYTLLAFTMLCTLPFVANAEPVEPGYDGDKPLASNVWYAPADQAAKQADLNFISGMRPHHAGALTMADDYLGDKNANNAGLQQLARGIKHNQTFEIKMLDNIENLRKTPDNQSAHFMSMRPAAIKDLSQSLQFRRAPMPGFMDKNAGSKQVSARDVQFAKAMIIHHQGALDMAHDYLKDPNAKNGYLRLMCLDILLDQSQEIQFMQDVISMYKGNPDDVKIDASMIHGMEGMMHHHGENHGAMAKAGHGKAAHKHTAPKAKSHAHKTHKAKAVRKSESKSAEQLKPIERHDMHNHGAHDYH